MSYGQNQYRREDEAIAGILDDLTSIVVPDELKEKYNTLEDFNKFLNSIGVKLNDSGGVIKESKDGFLLQSSSVANKVNAHFKEGMSLISGSYVEFAERKILPEFMNLDLNKINSTHRRDGFETSNADKIFESTYQKQVNK